MMTFRDAMDRFFDDAFTRPLNFAGNNWSVPAVDMYQTDNEVVVKASIPGVKTDEVQISVTGETAPHYFSLTDDIVAHQLSMAKMKPPLRTEKDRKMIIDGLRDGTIDVIATDHAPHSVNEKMQEMEYAPFGIIGLETALPLIITVLIKENGFSFTEAFEKITINPARILKLDRGAIKLGAIADITIIDPEKQVELTESFFRSKSKNTPFIGKKLYGSVEYTICNGTIVYSAR